MAKPKPLKAARPALTVAGSIVPGVMPSGDPAPRPGVARRKPWVKPLMPCPSTYRVTSRELGSRPVTVLYSAVESSRACLPWSVSMISPARASELASSIVWSK